MFPVVGYHPLSHMKPRGPFDRRRFGEPEPLRPFPLFDLNSDNLQKVFQKIESKSFRRLQRTSWETWGFVQKNSKIFVFTEGEYFLNVRRDTDPDSSFYFARSQWGSMRKIDSKGLYASRLAILQITDVNSSLSRDLFDFVKKYRITCDELILRDMQWQTEEYAELLEVLKPISVKQNSGSLTLFEALYSSPIIRNVTVVVKFDWAEMASKKFLATCSDVKITVAHENRETSEQLELFKTILQILLFEPRPQLQQFSFVLGTQLRELPSEARLAEELANFNVRAVRGNGEKARVYLNLPREHYPEGSRCELNLESPRFWRTSGAHVSAGDILFKRG